MTIHQSLYPNDGPPIHITIKYIPALDKENQGIWNIDTNQVALSWNRFSEYRNLEKQTDKKKFFESLQQISNQLI